MTMLYENIRLALYSLRANKMRALLTMLGIIIGISSVIAIVTVGNSLTTNVEESMSSMGANNITLSIQQRDEEIVMEDGMMVGQMMYRAPTEEDYFTRDMLKNYCETYPDSILALSASELLGSGQLRDGSIYANISLTGVSLGYFAENSAPLLSGRMFSEREMDDGAKVAIISDRAVNNLFGGDADAAIGSAVQASLNGKYYTFIVVGVYQYDESVMGFSTSAERDITTECFIPLRTAKAMNHSDGYLSLTVVTKQGVDADAFATATDKFFDTYYRNNRYFEAVAFSMASMVESMSETLSAITAAISVIAGIALLVGGIGVMNIMLVSITERTREIGTRKALGATNGSIRMQFIVEAIVICLIGGIIGIALGIGVGVAAANMLGAPAAPSAGSIVLSISFSMAIGVFFGYYPANKAAKMDPIEALRYE